MQSWFDHYNSTTEILSKYGWFVVPFMTGGDFEEIQKVCHEIEETDLNVQIINEKINTVLTPIIFNPNFRAFSVFKYIKLNHLNKFSHLVDRAVMHYFKKDYLSAIISMLPVVEGVLLSYYNWSYKSTNRKPRIKELIENFCATPQNTLNIPERKIYSDALKLCLSNWFFEDTTKFDFSNSFLNRHFISHSMGNESYYSLLECNRMFTIIDLISEVTTLDQSYNYAFIPKNEPIINNRRDYYFRLINKKIKLKEIMMIESNLLSHNIYYVSSENDIDYNNIIEKENKKIARFHKELDEKYRKTKSPISIRNRLKSEIKILISFIKGYA